jgi:hypothetical protein
LSAHVFLADSTTNAVDQSIVWSSSDNGIATVNVSGLVTGVAPGSANIFASHGGFADTLGISVCPSIALGSTYTALMPNASNTCFSGGSSGAAEYTYIPINLSTNASLSLTLLGSGIVGVTGPPSPRPFIPGLLTVGGVTLGTEELKVDDDWHLRMLEANRRIRWPSASARPVARSMMTETDSVGNLVSLNVGTTCSGTPDTRIGMVRSIKGHITIVSDTANPPGGFTTAQYDSIGLEMDTIGYSVVTSNFGAVPTINGNDQITVFFTRAVNELSPPASSSVVLGYSLPRDVMDVCPESNNRGMTYMLVPDPTGFVNSNVRTVSFVRGNTSGTFGHELQHIINSAEKLLVLNTGSVEETWLNEGLSHVAEELMFYRASGMSPRVNIRAGTDAISGIQLNSRRVAAYNTYESQNLTRMRGWLQRPDTTGPFKTSASLGARGAIWGFLRYAADRINGTDATFWTSLVNTSQHGTANLQTAIGADPNDWARDFLVSMYADDAVSGVASIYTNPSWNYRSFYQILYGSYQLVPRPLTNNTGLTLNYSPSAGTAFARFGVAANSFATLSALSGGVAPTSPFSLIVIRTK